MIYTCSGVRTASMTPIDIEPMEFLFNYKPEYVDISDYDDRDLYKVNQSQYFLTGELLNNKRNDSNLLYKEVLTFDYENLELSYEEFISKIQSELEGITYILYPTIHCFDKKGDKRFRYRLVIGLDREYNEEENLLLVRNVGRLIGLEYDKQGEKFSQLMGLPVITPYTNESMIIKNKGIMLSVDDCLAAFKMEKEQINVDFTHNGNKKYTAIVLEEIMAGVSEGNRNVWLTKQIGKFLYLGMDPNIAYQWLWLINDNFVKPALDSEELNTIFKSILNKELKRGG